jgi:hypothetical protein
MLWVDANLAREETKHSRVTTSRFAARLPVGRQVKNDDSQKRNRHAWNDEVHGVKQRLSSDCYVESYVGVRFVTARVVLVVFASRNGEKVPLDAPVEVLQVDSVLDYVAIAEFFRFGPGVLQIDL